MRKLSALLFLLGVLLCLPAPPATAGVDVNVNIGIPFPGFRVEVAPEMVLVPDVPVYFAPGLSVDLFFYDGFWYTRDGDHWFRGPDYRGPWRAVGPRHVPRYLTRIRPDYRTYYVRERHIPYGQLKKHWREHRMREDYRHDRGEWHDRGEVHDRDRDRDRDREHDRDWKEEKRERKHAEKEWKEERKEERGHGRGHGRD